MIKARRYREASAEIRKHPDIIEKRGNEGCEGVAGSSRRVLALYRPKDGRILPTDFGGFG